MEVQDIIKDAVTIGEDASFKEAIETMITGQSNTLLVTNQAGELVGEVSVSELLDAIVPEYLDGDSIAAHFATKEMFTEAVTDATEQQVKFFMNKELATVKVSDGLMAIATTALSQRQLRIPVVDDANKPVGIISRRGLKHIIAETLGVVDPS